MLLDAGLVVSVRSAARQRGMTIAAFVERALEVELDGYVDTSPGGSAGASVEGVGVRPDGGRDRVAGSVSPDPGRRVAPDWEALLVAGRDAKVMVAAGRDPLEEIA